MTEIQVLQSSIKSGVGKSGKPYKALIVKGFITDKATGEIRMVDDMCFFRDEPRPLPAGKYLIQCEIRVNDGRLQPVVVAFEPVKTGA